MGHRLTWRMEHGALPPEKARLDGCMTSLVSGAAERRPTAVPRLLLPQAITWLGDFGAHPSEVHVLCWRAGLARR